MTSPAPTPDPLSSPHAAPIPAPLRDPLTLAYETPGSSAARSLGSRVLTGAIWVLIQSVVTQLLTLAARIVVLRVVTNGDFATGTWALSACTFLIWLQPCMADVLVQRQRHVKQWAQAAFWWSMLSGVLVCLLATGIGSLLALRSHDWRLAPLMVIFAMAMAVQHLTTIWGAELNIGFRFRLIAGISTAGSVVVAVTTIGMAYGGMGAWTLVVPTLLGNILNLLLVIGTVKFHPRAPDAQLLRRSKPFLGTALLLSTAAFFSGLTVSADNFFLGLTKKEELAAYATAYTLSLSLVQLLTRSLRNVLLPAFSAMESDPERRDAAYLEALRLVSLIAMPGVMLMVPASRWVLTTMFANKGPEVVPLFQTLLVGMGFTVVYAIGFASMQSRGMYRRFLWANVFMGLAFCVVVWPAAALGGAQAVAVTVAIFYTVTALIVAIAAATPITGRRVGRILAAAGVPFVMACVSSWLGATAAWALGMNSSQVQYVIVSIAVGSGAFLVLSVWLLRGTVRALTGRVSHVLPARFQRGIFKKP